MRVHIHLPDLQTILVLGARIAANDSVSWMSESRCLGQTIPINYLRRDEFRLWVGVEDLVTVLRGRRRRFVRLRQSVYAPALRLWWIRLFEFQLTF